MFATERITSLFVQRLRAEAELRLYGGPEVPSFARTVRQCFEGALPLDELAIRVTAALHGRGFSADNTQVRRQAVPFPRPFPLPSVHVPCAVTLRRGWPCLTHGPECRAGAQAAISIPRDTLAEPFRQSLGKHWGEPLSFSSLVRAEPPPPPRRSRPWRPLSTRCACTGRGGAQAGLPLLGVTGLRAALSSLLAPTPLLGASAVRATKLRSPFLCPPAPVRRLSSPHWAR